MLTKYYIEIDGTKQEIPQRCIKNWDEIKCVYKRADFSGVTRSFTSQFEFVGEMYEKLMTLYLRDGVNAHATLSLFTITDNWEWEEQFSSELDFSSIVWDNNILKINCIDDSLASMIKARKGTKYEFVVGQDIPVADKLVYDRLLMPNSVSHEIMSNGDESDGNSILGGHKDGSVVIKGASGLTRLPTYVVGNAETYENSPIEFDDESDKSGSYFLKIINSTTNLIVDIEINYFDNACPLGAYVKNAEIYLMKFDEANPNINSNYVNLGTVFKTNQTQFAAHNRTYVGCYPSLSALKKAHPNPAQDVYAVIGKSNLLKDCEAVYFTPITLNVRTEWVQGARSFTGPRGNEIAYCGEHRFLSSFDLSNYKAGSMFALVYKCTMGWDHWYDPRSELHFSIKSKIHTKWESRAKPISIDALNPTSVLSALINRISDNKLNITTNIARSDVRLPKTYLFAAESIRNLPGAKLYTSFNDFSDWMETVFGYTYYIGPRNKAQFQRTQEYSLEWAIAANDHLLHSQCPGGFGHQVVLVKDQPYFAVLGDDYNADNTSNFYTRWNGSEDFNDPITRKVRLDTLFYDADYNQGIYFDSDYNLHTFSGDVNKGIRDSQSINFVPRKELFTVEKCIKLQHIRDLKYTLNTGIAYSSLIIGYEKQEYEAECGRDEWNFSAQYTTGVDKLEKRLTLISKYRADCYGFEFLSQERSKDTTDNKSDNTVFFVHCMIEEEEQTGTSDSRGDSEGDEISEITHSLYCDRSVVIVGALSDTVFNGEYAPYRCAQSNGTFIAAALCPMTLKFASFDGNTDVCVDGILGNDDIPLSDQLFSLGEVSFISSDIDTKLDVNAIYEVESNGIIYRGFIKEASFRYTNNEAINYKLIVKDIEL